MIPLSVRADFCSVIIMLGAGITLFAGVVALWDVGRESSSGWKAAKCNIKAHHLSSNGSCLYFTATTAKYRGDLCTVLGVDHDRPGCSDANTPAEISYWTSKDGQWSPCLVPQHQHPVLSDHCATLASQQTLSDAIWRAYSHRFVYLMRDHSEIQPIKEGILAYKWRIAGGLLIGGLIACCGTCSFFFRQALTILWMRIRHGRQRLPEKSDL